LSQVIVSNDLFGKLTITVYSHGSAVIQVFSAAEFMKLPLFAKKEVLHELGRFVRYHKARLRELNLNPVKADFSIRPTGQGSCDWEVVPFDFSGTRS